MARQQARAAAARGGSSMAAWLAESAASAAKDAKAESVKEGGFSGGSVSLEKRETKLSWHETAVKNGGEEPASENENQAAAASEEASEMKIAGAGISGEAKIRAAGEKSLENAKSGGNGENGESVWKSIWPNAA
jgi:hypothetical protein